MFAKFLAVTLSVWQWWCEADVIGGITRLCLFLGVVYEDYILVERPPIGWWEWFWSLFGYTYQERLIVFRFDLIRSGYYALLLLGILWLSFVAVRWLFRRLAQLVFAQVVKVCQAAFEKAYDLERVFRVPASAHDPGPIALDMPKTSIVAESLRKGSELYKSQTPKCQVHFGNPLPDGVTAAVGGGVRVQVPGHTGSFVITAHHVLTGLSEDFILFRPNVRRTCSIKHYQVSGVNVARPVLGLDTDTVAIFFSDDEMSALGVSVCKIHDKVPNSATVRIAGPDEQGSLGTLRELSDTFGYFVYSGSTVPGFSGCVYVGGGSDVGYAIHLHGGAVNTAYSLRLAYVTLAAQLKVKPENTEDFLERLYKVDREPILVDESYGSLDEVRIRVKGVYHVVDRASLAKLTGRRDPGRMVRYVDFENVEPESKNSLRTISKGPSSSSNKSDQGSAQDLLVSMLTTLRDLLPPQTAQQETSGKKRKKASSGQMKDQVVKNPSEST